MYCFQYHKKRYENIQKVSSGGTTDRIYKTPCFPSLKKSYPIYWTEKIKKGLSGTEEYRVKKSCKE